MIYSGNRYLTREEQEANATYIKDFLLQRGWTLNAICGMLGNMQAESTINPGIWQNLTENTSNGFGLCQWTPATKLISWANDKGLDPADMDTQLLRIIYEVETGTQYYKTPTYPLSFEAFTQSEKSPEYLAGAFLYNYERPKNYNIKPRQTNARSWWTFFGGSSELSPGFIPKGKKRTLPIWLIATATRKVKK